MSQQRESIKINVGDLLIDKKNYFYIIERISVRQSFDNIFNIWLTIKCCKTMKSQPIILSIEKSDFEFSDFEQGTITLLDKELFDFQIYGFKFVK